MISDIRRKSAHYGDDVSAVQKVDMSTALYHLCLCYCRCGCGPLFVDYGMDHVWEFGGEMRHGIVM